MSYVCRPVLFYGRPRTRSAITSEREPFDGGNEPINPLRTNVANSLEAGETLLCFDDSTKNTSLSPISYSEYMMRSHAREPYLTTYLSAVFVIYVRRDVTQRAFECIKVDLSEKLAILQKKVCLRFHNLSYIGIFLQTDR